jgi:hypothetical protein
MVAKPGDAILFPLGGGKPRLHRMPA